jgi:cell division GTPase FtsZ
MKILIIGLGGCGGRIADTLQAQDRSAGRVSCLEGIAIDTDAASMNQLTNLPADRKLYFPPLDPSSAYSGIAHVAVDEVIAKLHAIDTGDFDAIVLCASLGGNLVNTIPSITKEIRSSMLEPVFGLCTLPCVNEGPARSAKAADDIDMLSPVLDGIILFDNETWSQKLMGAVNEVKPRQSSAIPGIGRERPLKTRRQLVLGMINDTIARRVGLLLRAGEFSERGGVEIAEVVLDAGEVLNTIRGMGLITLGYAAEPLESDSLKLFTRLRPEKVYVENGHKKASRIVDLAKTAIYEDMSTPCDLTSAQKALILIAGPSHHLSMKGYMTVRKWIDRSIAGMEVRSGDYPIPNTQHIGIIIVLAGLSNIPRVNEVRQVRDQFRKTSVLTGKDTECLDLNESRTLIQNEKISFGDAGQESHMSADGGGARSFDSQGSQITQESVPRITDQETDE